MSKSHTQSTKIERYKKLESKPTWRATKLILIGFIIFISLLATVGLWSKVNDCYIQSDAHDRWTPNSSGVDWFRGAQPKDCDPESATQAGGVMTMLIPVVGILVYRLFRYTAAYVAYGSEKRDGQS